MKRQPIIFVICFLVLVGCATFNVVKPIYPKVGNPNLPPKKVDSLQPTFRWEPITELDATYDFIIYEGIKIPQTWTAKSHYSPGRELYYREGLKEAQHRIEEPLKPDSVYFWSVRLRRGSKISQWSRYDYGKVGSLQPPIALDWPFGFRTPDK